MNKKILLASLSLVILAMIAGGILFFIYGKENSSLKNETQTGSTTTPFIETQSKEDKISEAKRRMSLRTILRKGDYYSIKNDKEAALRYYLSAYKKTGENDHVIEKKIADTYFELKKWNDAYTYYKKLPFKELDTETKSHFFAAFMSDTLMQDRQKELDIMPEDQNIKAYYSLIGNCTTGIRNCYSALDSFSGNNADIEELRAATKNASSVSSDPYYRDSLLAATLYKQKQYFAASKVSEEILQKRPDYKVILKTAGLCHFELGNYEKAAGFFKSYYEIEPKDVQVSYVLGIIFYYLEDYSTSNLYFNAAVLNGYRPKTELERRLVYNYYLLGDYRSAFKIFRYLLDETDSTVEDYQIAVYTCIEEREYGKGMNWVNAGIEKWKDDDQLIALRSWIYLLQGEPEKAYIDAKLALEKNSKNALALLKLGTLYSQKKEYTVAESYYQAAIDADASGIFGEDAAAELETMQKKKAEELVNSGSTSSGVVDVSGNTSSGSTSENQPQ